MIGKSKSESPKRTSYNLVSFEGSITVVGFQFCHSLSVHDYEASQPANQPVGQPVRYRSEGGFGQSFQSLAVVSSSSLALACAPVRRLRWWRTGEFRRFSLYSLVALCSLCEGAAAVDDDDVGDDDDGDDDEYRDDDGIWTSRGVTHERNASQHWCVSTTHRLSL